MIIVLLLQILNMQWYWIKDLDRQASSMTTLFQQSFYAMKESK